MGISCCKTCRCGKTSISKAYYYRECLNGVWVGTSLQELPDAKKARTWTESMICVYGDHHKLYEAGWYRLYNYQMRYGQWTGSKWARVLGIGVKKPDYTPPIKNPPGRNGDGTVTPLVTGQNRKDLYRLLGWGWCGRGDDCPQVRYCN